uniref:Uncharacterized protein n=1 Tax=Rhizophora mucronata TaxID=61149 RepID=A0A2P2Q9W0_RHIMU
MQSYTSKFFLLAVHLYISVISIMICVIQCNH